MVKLDKTAVFIIPMVIMLSGTPSVCACEPCMKIHDLKESLATADAVIVGTKIEEAPYKAVDRGPGGPDWIEVKVRRILKGNELPAVIKANAWDGMCAYGFILDENKDYLMLLAEPDPAGHETQYRAVFDGCGAKAFEVSGGHVLLSEEAVPWTEFERRWLTDNSGTDTNKYMISSTYCEKDADCAVRDGACGPEAMNIYFDNSKLVAMQPYVECADYVEVADVFCQDGRCRSGSVK